MCRGGYKYMDNVTYEYIEKLILKYLLVITIIIALIIIFILPMLENKIKRENAKYNQAIIKQELEEEKSSS